MRALLRTVVDDLIKSAVGRLDPTRWAAVPVVPGSEVLVYGPVFGRRFAEHGGAVAVLALQPDGGFRPAFAMVEEAPEAQHEMTVRSTFVCSQRRPFARVHAFTPSPVYPELCQVCAEDAPLHDQRRVRDLVERTLAPAQVEVQFLNRTATVIWVTVRPVQEIPAPKFDDQGKQVPQAPPPRPPWRPFTRTEYQRLLAEGVQFDLITPDTWEKTS